MCIKKKIAEDLKKAKKEQKIKWNEACVLAGISSTSLANVLNGTATLDYMVKLAKVLKVPVILNSDEKVMPFEQSVQLVKSMPLDQAMQQIKSKLTGKSKTQVIEGYLVVKLID